MFFVSRLLMVAGRLQREGKVVHVIVSECFDFTKMPGKLVKREVDDLPVLTLVRGMRNQNLMELRIKGLRLSRRFQRMSFMGAEF